MSKLISRNNNITKYKEPSQKIESQTRLTDDDLMLTGWQRLYYDNDPNHRQVKDDDPLRKTLDVENYDWWVGDLLGNLVPKETVLNYLNTKNAPASNATLEKRWEDRASELDLLEVERELQHRRNEQFNKDADTVFIKAPVTLLGLGIGGATALPYLLPGTVGGNIIGTTALGEALNRAIKYGTGKTTGEHMVNAAHYLGIPLSKWGDFGIQMLGDTPVYLTGDIVGKAITNAGRTLGREALKLMALDNIPSTKDLAISRILLLNDMVKIAATSKVTPERQRLWKGLMYLTNGRPSEGIKQAAKRLSSDELVYLMKYVRTGDTNALAKLEPGYMGFIRRMFKPKSWRERYASTIDPTKIDLLDLTLQIQNNIVNVPKLYSQLAKSSAILPKNETVDILGGLIVGNKSAITNPYILNLLASENVPKGFTPIVTDEYANGINAIKRLNTETPIMQYSLQTHQIKSNKLGEEGMFNTTGMHNFIYKDPESRNLKLVEVDVFKNTIGGIKQKYAGIENEATNLYGKMVSKGKQHMFKKFNLAEQSPVLIVKEKDLDVNDILNALAMQEKHIYLGRASLEAGQITKEQFATIQKEAQLTEARLLEMLTDMNPEYYLTKLTEVNNKSRRLLGKPDANGHFRDKSDIHIESVLDKIILTQGSRKIPQTTIPEDRERLNEIIRSSMKYGKEKATLHTAIHKSLIGTPETLNPVYKHYYRIAEPEAYSKAIREHDLKSFTEAPLDNISVLFNYGKAYNPQVLTPSTQAKLNNTLYIILRYDLKDPNVRQKAMEMVEKGYTLFDPQKMKDPNVFYNTIKECKEQYMKKLQEIIPFVSSKIKPHLIKSQKATITLPSTLKSGGKLIPRKFQFGGIPELSDMALPDLTVYVGPKGGKSKIDVENEAMWKKAEPYYRELIAAGINPYVAVGVLGNMALESAFNPNANRNGKYHGLTQNQTEAKNWIVKNYGGYGKEHQMRFLTDGLKGLIKDNNKIPWQREFFKRFSGFINATKNLTNIDAIVDAWEKHYERSGGQGLALRRRYANYFAKMLGLIK